MAYDANGNIGMLQRTGAGFQSFSEEQLQFMGTASEKPVSVRAIGFITLGHQKHHAKIIRERYL